MAKYGRPKKDKQHRNAAYALKYRQRVCPPKKGGCGHKSSKNHVRCPICLREWK